MPGSAGWRGSLALNLIATVGRRGSQQIERMPDTTSLRSWCTTSRLALDEGIDETELLTRAHGLREHAYALTRAVVHAEAVAECDLEAINAVASFPVPAPCLLSATTGVQLAPSPLSIEAVLSVIARDLAQVLGSPDLRDRLRECDSGDCRMIYLAPAGREQRWCSMPDAATAPKPPPTVPAPRGRRTVRNPPGNATPASCAQTCVDGQDRTLSATSGSRSPSTSMICSSESTGPCSVELMRCNAVGPLDSHRCLASTCRPNSNQT
jgi:predicted RNA-binding Zn ribbon-like protein